MSQFEILSLALPKPINLGYERSTEFKTAIMHACMDDGFYKYAKKIRKMLTDHSDLVLSGKITIQTTLIY